VGANFFLPRLDGELGTYIALTSERLNGFAVYQARIATHFVHSSKMDELLEALLSLDLQDKKGASLSSSVDACIERFTSIDENTKSTLVGEKRKAIDRCFKYNRMEGIVAALTEESQSSSEDLAGWAKETRKTIESKSPTSLKVTLEGLRRGKHMSINEVLQMDMEIGEMFCVSQV
jgi:3-hydroxyisobutyryl-CoA hydrolase